jgi:toxin ParE1/3/4
VTDVILSRAARDDLAEIVRYGAANFGVDAVEAYQDAIDKAFARLEDFPRSGEARPDYGSGLRCLICRKHRILYRIQENVVRIIRILHHSRDVPRHLPDDR